MRLVVALLLYLFCASVIGRSIQECVNLVNLLDFEHVEGGSLGGLTERICNRFDWFREEYRLSPQSYRQWVLEEQFELATDDLLTVPSLTKCWRQWLQSRPSSYSSHGSRKTMVPSDALDLWGEIQRALSLGSSEQRTQMCRSARKYMGEGSSHWVGVVGVNEVKKVMGIVCEEEKEEKEEEEQHDDNNDDDDGEKKIKKKHHDHDGDNDHGVAGDNEWPVMRRAMIKIQRAVRQMLERKYVATFIKSQELKQCRRGATVTKDVSNYVKLRRKFCEDERNAFRNGDKERKQATILVMKQSLANHCRTNPNFDFQHL